MVDEEKLSAVLSEFARTLITDFPIQGILDHLVQRIVAILPVTAAGVTLISPGEFPHYIAASNEAALHFEQLQASSGQGPCVTAYESGQAVAVPDLAADPRFPLFKTAAVQAGLAAVFTFPLCHGVGRLGALDLYRDTIGDLAAHDMAVAQTLADVAAAYLLNAQARDEATATSDRFHHSATHDPLTGLPNRLLLQERLEHAAQRAKRSHAFAAVLFADLDHFKDVNDVHGHQIGDELLVAVARRLSGLVRSGDTLARFSGDEFVILFEDLHDPADADKLAGRIEDAFVDTFSVSDVDVRITASVGLAFAGAGQDISGQLIVEADLAMYEVKRAGGSNHQVVDAGRARHSSLEQQLRTALDADELDVAYQPIVRTSDGVVIGVEALLRWTDPYRGSVSPTAMVAVAEHSGFIDEIGVWVLARACRDHRGWSFEHPGVALELSVNVSGGQLVHAGFLAAVRDVLARTEMAPSALILEMTESVFVDETDRVASVLDDLGSAGVRLAIDDFGTGYSSLSYLARLPVHIVKIDQDFVARIDHAPGRKIIAAVAALAHDLGLSVIAEGVETLAQRDAVLAIGCDGAQGFHFARPMSATAISACLDNRLGQRRSGRSDTGPWRLPDDDDGGPVVELVPSLPAHRQVAWAPPWHSAS